MTKNIYVLRLEGNDVIKTDEHHSLSGRMTRTNRTSMARTIAGNLHKKDKSVVGFVFDTPKAEQHVVVSLLIDAAHQRDTDQLRELRADLRKSQLSREYYKSNRDKHKTRLARWRHDAEQAGKSKEAVPSSPPASDNLKAAPNPTEALLGWAVADKEVVELKEALTNTRTTAADQKQQINQLQDDLATATALKKAAEWYVSTLLHHNRG